MNQIYTNILSIYALIVTVVWQICVTEFYVDL